MSLSVKLFWIFKVVEFVSFKQAKLFEQRMLEAAGYDRTLFTIRHHTVYQFMF